MGTANEHKEYNTLRMLRTGMKTFMDAQRPTNPPVKVAVRTVPYIQKFKRFQIFFLNFSSIKFYKNPSSGSRVM